jgi:hypothetical protein
VSGPIPQNYVIHTVVIAIAMVVALVVFLMHQWG